jgi:hypothetical protein
MSDPTYPYDVYTQGGRIVNATLRDLATGPRLYGDHDPASPDVVSTLPSLAGADTILLTCHSNGCNGLHMSIDSRAALLATVAPSAEVRAVFNNFLIASAEGEHAVDETSPTGAIDGTRSAYDHVDTGLSISEDEFGDHRPYGRVAFQPGGTEREKLEQWGAILDESCLDFHAADPAPCYDTIHVLLNHLETPFFYNFAQTDNSLSDGMWDKAPYCQQAPGEDPSCPFAGVEAKWQMLVRKQAADLFLLGPTDRCEAGSGAGPYDRIAVWGPAWGSHEGWHNSTTVQQRLGPSSGMTATLRQAVHLWVTMPVFNEICLEEDASVDPTGSNASLGLGPCVGP